MTGIERGAVRRVAGAYDSMIVGSKGVSYPGAPVWQEQKAILEVILQNDPSSQSNILIGNEFGQYVVIVPGASITVPINNLNRVQAATAPGESATLNWIAMT